MTGSDDAAAVSVVAVVVVVVAVDAAVPLEVNAAIDEPDEPSDSRDSVAPRGRANTFRNTDGIHPPSGFASPGPAAGSAAAGAAAMEYVIL